MDGWGGYIDGRLLLRCPMKRRSIIVFVSFFALLQQSCFHGWKVSVFNWHINLHCLDDEIYLHKSETLLFRPQFYPLFMMAIGLVFGIWGFWDFQASRRDSYKQNCGTVAIHNGPSQKLLNFCLHFLIEFEAQNWVSTCFDCIFGNFGKYLLEVSFGALELWLKEIHSSVLKLNSNLTHFADLQFLMICDLWSCKLFPAAIHRKSPRAASWATFATSIKCRVTLPLISSPLTETKFIQLSHNNWHRWTDAMGHPWLGYEIHNDYTAPHFCFHFGLRFVYMHIKWYKRSKRQQQHQHYNCSCSFRIRMPFCWWSSLE